MNNIATLIAETLASSDKLPTVSERDQFIKDTMLFAYAQDNRGAGCILERAEVLEFDETLMLLEAR